VLTSDPDSLYAEYVAFKLISRSSTMKKGAIECNFAGILITRTRHTMIQNSQKARPHTEVIAAAPAQAPILANLLELYAHDFSEFRRLEIGDDGRFGYPSLPLYWSEPDRHPFLVEVDGKLAGLVFVKRVPGMLCADSVWDMAEFFVIRGRRRRGIGTQVAHEVWRRFPGLWEVRVMQTNTSARHFWAEAISRFVGDVTRPVQIEKGGDWWTLFSFESNQAHPSASE
jgi:predicted acetyltransferase